ncbi:unnamed protein product, partial [Porites lobata]
VDGPITGRAYISSSCVNQANEVDYESTSRTRELDWEKIYLLPFKTTLDTKLREFQYKILNRILYTNKMLTDQNLRTSNCPQTVIPETQASDSSASTLNAWNRPTLVKKNCHLFTAAEYEVKPSE